MQSDTVVDYSHYQRIQVDIRDDGIAVLTLNNPAKLNAVDEISHHEANTQSAMHVPCTSTYMHIRIQAIACYIYIYIYMYM